jgi:hypothetical protein
MFPCDPVGLELIDTARFRSTNSVDLSIDPGQLWQVLEDEESWPQWSYVTRMSWTGPKPFGIGTTRAIETRSGGHVVDEVIAWHPQAHLAFRVNSTSAETEGASVEEFRIDPTAQGCRLTWTLAHDPKDPPLLAKLVAGRVLNAKYRQYLKQLRSYTDRRFGVSI